MTYFNDIGKKKKEDQRQADATGDTRFCYQQWRIDRVKTNIGSKECHTQWGIRAAWWQPWAYYLVVGSLVLIGQWCIRYLRLRLVIRADGHNHHIVYYDTKVVLSCKGVINCWQSFSLRRPRQYSTFKFILSS